MTEPTDALLPCPFCGEVPHLKRSIKGDYTSIVCPAACGGPLVIVIPNDRIEEGIAAWNRRTNSTMGQPAQAADSVGREADRIEKWSDRIQRAHPKSEPEFWPDALRVKYMADEISDLRAARAPADSVQEDAARYRNAIASACEGWTMPDGLRKHLETALWSPPTPQPTQPQPQPQPVARVPLTPERVKEIVRGAGYDQCGIPDTERAAFINGLRHGEQAHGIKGGQHVS